MTKEQFIKILDKKDYSYEIEGDKIVVTSNVYLDFSLLKGIPSGLVFKNDSKSYLIYLDLLKKIPSDVVFENGGGVYLMTLTGGWFNECDCNIEDIESNRLLNYMISKGLFNSNK